MLRRAAALAVVVFLTTGAGFAIVGDSVTQDAREELRARGATVYANGGVDIVTGRDAIRQLSREGRRRAVIELGLMDVGHRTAADDLRRRVRAVMRDDIGGIGCVIWVDLVDWPRREQASWPERAGEFNTILNQEAARFGVHVAQWSRFSDAHRDWFRADGVHLRLHGQRGFARWVDGRVDHFC